MLGTSQRAIERKEGWLGENDIPYIQAASDFMIENIASARKVVMRDAAHLCNMDHPEEFDRIVKEFLDEISQ